MVHLKVRPRNTILLAAAVALGLVVVWGISIIYATLTTPTMDLKSTTADVTILGATGGLPQGDAIGRRLAAGDFNGDTIADVLIGAPNADGPGNARLDSGEAYVVFGRSVGSPITVDINSGGQDVTIVGAATGNRLGTAVAAGDVNGDTFDDVIIGASEAANGALLSAGAVYVFYGSAAISGTKDISSVAPDVTIKGGSALDKLGQALAAGDIDNDGDDDIIIGAPRSPAGGRAEAGQVYGIFGSGSLPATLTTGALGTAGFSIIGASSGDTLGSDVAVGRVDSDSNADILIGAENALDAIGVMSGEAYLVLGSPAPGSSIDLAVGGWALKVVGADEVDELGSRVVIGDVNNDGFGDMIIAAPNAAGPGNVRNAGGFGAGEAYVVYGAATVSGTVNIVPGGGSITTIYAAEAEDEMSRVGAADVDGDTIADIVFSSDDGDGAGNSRTDAGEAFVSYSSSTLPAAGTVIDVAGTVPGSVTPALTVFAAEALDDLGAGYLVADFDGDNGGDLVIGAPGADGPSNGRPNAGEVYVLLGAAGTPPGPTATPTITPTPCPGGKVPASGGGCGTPTPTPPKLPFPADTDGDGCADVNESLPKAQSSNGGGRDWLNPWDYYNVNGDGVIDLLNDILGVIQHYQPTPGGAAPYGAAFDRGPTTGPHPWNMTAPDGVIDLLNDVLGVILQYNPTGCT